MTNSTHDQIEPTPPTWRFWLLTLVGFPVAGAALVLAASAAGALPALAGGIIEDAGEAAVTRPLSSVV